ncbi:MAG: NAD(P)H-dependent oxidoreductase [Alphaproteobacteria bacterium]|uniref:NADPH-dependent FMN reductase n=1 Tax=Pyruvatibacter sp. HU-CL02332 TaxID=3127650 RepID=UPI0029689311|nr:NAD(P)H-dependent oxidoreductase [Alphaproteobacteria bacterium]
MADCAPLIVGLGGTLRHGSSTQFAVERALDYAGRLGATTRMFAGPELELPFYAPETPDRSQRATALVDALRQADGVVIGSPGYHGSVSGLIKNALDYAEDLSRDPRPYLDGRAVGLIAAGAGMQAAVTTLGMLRDVTHALRGTPTPYGVVFNSTDKSRERTSKTELQLETLAEQIVALAWALRG